MDLREFLFLHNIDRDEMAKVIGVCYAMIHKYVNREVSPSLEVALAIYDATDGLVSFEEMASLPPEERAKNKMKKKIRKNKTLEVKKDRV